MPAREQEAMMPAIRRVYADTSVYGGVCDPEFAAHSARFFEQIRQGLFRLVASAVVERKIREAPERVRQRYEEAVTLADTASVTSEALELQAAYLDAGIVSDRFADDALHVALATLAGCDILVSWNFKHIVHVDKGPRYNAVNVLRGLRAVAIHSPAEVVRYEEGL